MLMPGPANLPNPAALADALSSPRGWPEHLQIRECRRTDAADLWAIFDEDSYHQSGTLLERFASPSDVADWLEDNRTGNFVTVAVVGDAVVGFAGLYPLRGRQGHAGFVSLGVRSDHRRRGYGGALLRVILATADHLAGLSRLQLYVLVDNAAAIALYRGCGFQIEGRHAAFARRDTADGGTVDAFSMARVRQAPPIAHAGSRQSDNDRSRTVERRIAQDHAQ